MTLSEGLEGQSLRITAIEGGQGLRQNLMLRGISEGSTLRVVSNGNGPVVLELNGSTIALGRGMAAKVRVSAVRG